MARKQLTEAAQLHKHIEYGVIPSELCVVFYLFILCLPLSLGARDM